MSKGSSPTKDRATQRLPTRFGFLLIDDFTLISMSSAIETLRMANRLSGEDIYAWKTISETGEGVCASDGLCINADRGIDDLGGRHCSGNGYPRYGHPAYQWCRADRRPNR